MNNPYITTWKNTIKTIIYAYDLEEPLSEEDEKNLIKELAEKQYKMLEDARPDKTKTMLEQANEQQKEMINYLINVKETGIL